MTTARRLPAVTLTVLSMTGALFWAARPVSGAEPESVPAAGLPATASRAALVVPPESLRRTKNLLNDAEKLVLRFRGYPDLSGDYRINVDQTVSIPVIGRIRVSGLSPEDLERTLSERLASVTGRESYATVEIAEYRPIFVTGYVTRPGASPWQPAMTVLQAVAIAGGVYRGPETAGAAAMPAEAERARIKRATTDLKSSIATLARLRAELHESPRLDTPPSLVDLLGQTEAEAIMRSQQSILTSRRTSLQSQLAAFELGARLASDELAGLHAQGTRLKELLRTRKQYKQSIDDLTARGVLAVTRGLEEEIRVSDLEEKNTNVAVAIARVQGTAAGLRRDATRLRADRTAELEAEIQKVEREVAQLEIELSSARETYTRLTGEIAPISDRKRKVVVEYSVVWQDGPDETRTSTATELTRLRPGDVLVVSAQEVQ